MDQGSSQILVDGNKIYVVARSSNRFHQASVNTLLQHNRLVSSPGVPVFCYNATDPDSMIYENNLGTAD